MSENLSLKSDYTYNNQSIRDKNGALSFYLVENDGDSPFVFAAICYIPPQKGSAEFSAYLGYALANNLIPDDQEYELLGILSQLKCKTSFISSLIESGEILHPLQINSGDAFQILNEIAVCSTLGVMCHIPNWWKNHTNCSVVLNVGGIASNLGRFDILTKRPSLIFNHEPISEGYLKHILEVSNGLVFLKGKWVEADPSKIESVLKLYNQLKNKLDAQTVIQSLRALNLEDSVLQLDGVSNKEWVSSFESKINLIKDQPIDTFEFEYLRPYQSKGVNWITYMSTLNLGILLADDMGLGKTLQTLAFLKHNYCPGKHTLIIAPASLLANWVAECKKYTPNLSIGIVRSKCFRNPETDLVVTNYEMVSKIIGLEEVYWDTIVIDEAQAIKNPLTSKSLSVKKLKCRFKIALTGTPVENRLLDLWSIFDFILPGYLGTEYEFDKFVQTMKKDYRSFDPLKQMISPFILRRLKTDKSIINDLPEKIEIDEHVKLTDIQIELYNKEYDKLSRALFSKKKPPILPMLTKFKQICNHPDQYLGLSTYRPEFSGKFEYLRDICDTIFLNKEKVLVFTQYKALIDPIKTFLSNEFNVQGLSIDGSVNPISRKTIVDLFNEPNNDYRFMVLSIKAAGVGLNLIAATHVVHFDRWWNPAVENQATDRAYRIGQTRNVIVHKLICDDTLEEKIDQMIHSKLLLSESVICPNDSSLESIFQRMEPKELLKMVKLSNY